MVRICYKTDLIKWVLPDKPLRWQQTFPLRETSWPGQMISAWQSAVPPDSNQLPETLQQTYTHTQPHEYVIKHPGTVYKGAYPYFKNTGKINDTEILKKADECFCAYVWV